MAVPISRKVKRNATLFLLVAGGILWFPVVPLLLGSPPWFLRNLGFFSELMIATGTLGTALALVYVVGNRRLAPVIVAHFIVTTTIQPGIMLAAFSGQMRRAAPPTTA